MTSRVLVSIRVNASAERAFDVFTRQIGEWWTANDLFQFTPRSPGELAFELPGGDGQGGRLIETLANGTVFEIGKIRAWEPARRLVVGWRQATFGPEHDTEVEVRFEPLGDSTRVTVEHRGWETVPQEHAARHGFPLDFFLRRHAEYWRSLLGRLSNHITDCS